MNRIKANVIAAMLLVAALLLVAGAQPAAATDYILITGQTATGYSAAVDQATATCLAANGSKTITFVLTGAAVNVTSQIREDAPPAVVKTITFASAGAYKYATTHRMNRLDVYSTIVAGKIDSITVRCDE